MRYLQSTLHVRPEVAACVAALNHAIHANPHYDRLVQLDRYVIRARVRQADAIFSIAQPVGIDTMVVIKGSARVRAQWAWQPVSTRCGLKAGQVVALSITPRDAPVRPAATPRPQPDTGDGAGASLPRLVV
ncbi:MAG: BspC domain-containing protein [Janthinobacterium lividum]